MQDSRFLHRPRYSNSHALIIGIDQYKAISPLEYAKHDALGVRDVLVSSLDFPAENITTLLDQEATRANIHSAFLALAEAKTEIDDRVVLFYAGHGETRTAQRGEVGYLVPHDADETLASLIRWDEFTRNADHIRAKHMLFIMDACYGGLALTRSTAAGSARFLRDMLVRRSRQVLTAGKANEVVADSGGPIPNHSVFTGHLIEGLRGAAATPEGTLTANGVMAYVYHKVSSDKNSNQTPHFGHFDGDGDFILKSAETNIFREPEEAAIESMIVVPFASSYEVRDSVASSVDKTKRLLATTESAIELHDFVTTKLRELIALTAPGKFNVGGNFSVDELTATILRYEEASEQLSAVLACIGSWAKPNHYQLIRKVIARLVDSVERSGGTVIWLDLQWLPSILISYSTGIAAVEGRNYAALAALFLAEVEPQEGHSNGATKFIELMGERILALNRSEAFKRLPGNERKHTPMSEYLFSLLQRQLDEVLFIGRGYESAFDEYEILQSISVAHYRLKNNQGMWAPLGRFAWKESHFGNGPLSRLLKRARSMGNSWEPLQAGMFDGDFAEFDKTAAQFEQFVGKIPF